MYRVQVLCCFLRSRQLLVASRELPWTLILSIMYWLFWDAG